MPAETTNREDLPNDVGALKSQIRFLQARVDQLEEEKRRLLSRQFGPSSEKDPTPQMRLFNEPEEIAEQEEAVDAEETVTVPEHKRRKSGRKPLPDHLPRIEVEHDLADEEKVCDCGCQLTRIGEEVSEQLDIIPAKIQVIRNIRVKYACKGCEETVRMDETRIQVLKEPDREAQSQSCIWVQRGGPPKQSVVLFHYDKSKAAKVAQTLLEEYAGFLQVDGNPTYDTLAKAHPEIRLVGCMAHARRKFFEAKQAQGKKRPAGKAQKGLSLIQKLYGIEQSIKDKKLEEKQRIREERATPVLNELHAWALDSVDEVPPTSLTGKALHYLLEQWLKLIRYVEDGRLHIDNNATERAIRPFVVKRSLCTSCSTI